MLTSALMLGLTGAAAAAWVFARAPKSLRIPLTVYNGFYLLTSVIGAIVIGIPGFQPFWALAVPGMDTRWLNPGASFTYWVLVFGPFIVTNVVAFRLRDSSRPAAIFVARNFSMQPSMLAVTLVGAAFIGYCLFNLASRGYLGVSLLDSQNVGLYRENIQLRTEMASTLGEVHYGLIYMAIPALCVTALLRAYETRRFSWWLLCGALSAGLMLLYMSTLMKSNIIVFLVALGVAAYRAGRIRIGGTALVALAAVIVLTALETLLAGTGLLEVAATLSNIIFRLSSAIPFYAEVFPAQLPFVGIDYGLQWFGIGPEVPANLAVFNYMYPDLRWVRVRTGAGARHHLCAGRRTGGASRRWFSWER